MKESRLFDKYCEKSLFSQWPRQKVELGNRKPCADRVKCRITLTSDITAYGPGSCSTNFILSQWVGQAYKKY